MIDMNERNILVGKMFLILGLVFTLALFLAMPLGYSQQPYNTGLGGVTSGIGNLTSGLGNVVGNMLNPNNPLGKITLTTGLLFGSFYGTEALQNKLAGGSPAAKEGAQWGNVFGQIGGILGGLFGSDVSKVGGSSGMGALIGGLANFATTIIGGAISASQNSTIATVQRMIYVRVKTLDVEDGKIYEPKFKTYGSVDVSNKVDVNFMSDQNFVKKYNDKYYIYYPVELNPNQENIRELENLVLRFDVKGLPENIGKTPLPKTLSDNKAYANTPQEQVDAMKLDVSKNLGWCKIKNEKELAKLDSEVSKDNVEHAIEEAQEKGVESFVLLFKNLTQEEQMINIPNYNCFSANGLRGVTGATYKPKLEYDWSTSIKWDEKCIAQDGRDYVYCDALQFNMALLSRLKSTNADLTKIKSLEFLNTMDLEITNPDAKIVYEKLNFRVYLMKDGYTKDFFNDFVDYVLNTTFLAYHEDDKTLIEDLYANNKIEFRPLSYASTSAEGYKLEKAGMYNVTLGIIYKDAKGDKFISEKILNKNLVNSNIEKVIVYLELVQEENNPVYYMPLDATMGVKNGVIERIGYGVDYKGDAIWFKKGTDGMLLEPSLRSNSTPILSLNMISEGRIEVLNGFNKGLLLQISPRAGATGVTYDITRYLSYPAPVGLSLTHNKDGPAYAFYTINVANSPRTAGNSFLDWTLVCEEGFDCKSFDGSSTLDEIGRADIFGVNSKVPIGQYQSVAYGLYWDKDSIERDTNNVKYVSLVYLPEDALGTMNIITSSGNAKLYVDTSFKTGGLENISLSPEFRTTINDLESIYKLVETERVCMGYAEGSYDLKFWWNQAKFFPETQTE